MGAQGKVLEFPLEFGVNIGRADVIRRALLADLLGFRCLTVNVGRDGARTVQFEDGEAVKAVLFVPFGVAGVEFRICPPKDAHRKFASGQEGFDKSRLLVGVDDVQDSFAHLLFVFDDGF